MREEIALDHGKKMIGRERFLDGHTLTYSGSTKFKPPFDRTSHASRGAWLQKEASCAAKHRAADVEEWRGQTGNTLYVCMSSAVLWAIAW